MGDVYLADDPTLHRAVAIKVLRADLISNNDRLLRFEREAYTASSLNHPNILTIYEFGHESDYHFIVTEVVEGESLGQRLRREAVSLFEVLEIGIQIASALSAAHARGIVHRDIKPDNIMIRSDHLVKVLDFGLAKLSEEARATVDTVVLSESVTTPGIVMGTARYMSPEQARGLPVDTRTDIWSLGVVLYQMTAGHPPFVGKTMSDVIAAVLKTEPPLITQSSPDVPEELERIVRKALRKERDERYQLVNDLELDLRTLKRRIEFEADLAQHGEASSEAVTKPLARAVRTKAELRSAHNTDELTQVHSTSSAEYLVGELKRHKRGALLVLTAIIAFIIAGSYFTLTRYLRRTGEVGITSLAVLPFANTSNDPEKEYLSDGISESLVNRLSQLPGVKVISNTSSSRYKGDIDPLEVARALNVSVLLTGKILQRGDNLSISAELINATDRTQLWGRQYTRKSSDLLSVQAEISKEIAENLRVRLTANQQKLLVRPDPINPEAYELLLKGRFFRSRGKTDDRKKAGEFFNQAIAVDPNYAPAYADLSDIYRSLITSSVLDSEDYLAKAKAASQKALELDPNLAEAQYAQANLKTYDWEWDDAERAYKRAVELDPNLALAHRWFASYLRLRGRHDEAITEINRARELDPLSPGVNATVGYLLLNARQYDRAIESLKKTLELDQQYPYAHLFLGFTYGAKEMYPEAVAAYNEAIKLGLDTPTTKIYLAATYARAGNRHQAQKILEDLQRTKDAVSPGELAIFYTAMGDHEQAFASLEKAFKSHDPQLQYLGVSYWFDPLRSDPRFQDLIRRIGLAQ